MKGVVIRPNSTNQQGEQIQLVELIQPKRDDLISFNYTKSSGDRYRFAISDNLVLYGLVGLLIYMIFAPRSDEAVATIAAKQPDDKN